MAAVRAFILSATACIPPQQSLPARSQEDAKKPASLSSKCPPRSIDAMPLRPQDASIDRRSVLLGAVVGGAIFFERPGTADAARKYIGKEADKKVDNSTKNMSAYDQRILAKNKRKSDLEAKVAEAKAKAAKQ